MICLNSIRLTHQQTENSNACLSTTYLAPQSDLPGVFLDPVNLDGGRKNREPRNLHRGEIQPSWRSVSIMNNIKIELAPLIETKIR